MMTKKEIELQCELAYQQKFLELIGKKVGDKVKCEFVTDNGGITYSDISSIEGYGTIIKDEEGYAVLSDMEYRVSKSVRNKPWSVCDFRTHREYSMAKRRSKLNYIILG